VVKETLRMPVAAVKTNDASFTFKGIHFPKYTQFFAPIQDFQVDTDYIDPMEFNPDRKESSP
jgi:hypothetical protein